MRLVKYFSVAIVFIIIDQITKAIFAARDFFVGPIHIHSVKNFGLSFGLNFGTGLNLVILLLAVILFLAFLRGQKMSMAVALLVAGVVSNLIDRFAMGYVRDFLDIGLGFTFNLADSYIALGLVMLIQKSPKTDDKI